MRSLESLSVLAIAVLGIIMVGSFAHSLRKSLATQALNPSVVKELEANVTKLGSLDAPPDQDPQTRARIRTAITGSFVFGFRMIMLICATLAIASAVVAWRMIPFRAGALRPGFDEFAVANENSS